MRKLGCLHFLAGCLIAVQFLFIIKPASAQYSIARGKKQPELQQIKSSYRNSSADTTGQRQKLFNVLKQLNKTKGIYFFISDASLGDILVTPVADENQLPEKILGDLLKNTGLKFRKLNEKTFVIVPQASTPVNLPEQARPGITTPVNQPDSLLTEKPLLRIVKGKVSTIDGEALPDVTVSVKGKGRGAATNSNGEFYIEGSKGEVLEFSSVGYTPREIIIDDDALAGNLNAQLLLVNRSMNEVVVTALGVKKNSRSLGYSISTISAEELTSSGNTNFASALYGKAPGVRITAAPGGATSAVQVQVRGLNSLNFNSQPLFVVDGVVIRNTNEKGVNGINNQGYWDDQRIRGNGILDINPADIDNLSILKGASATALYGSEAASGVVVITTKKGLHKQGLGVEVNYTGTIEQAAFMPRFQNIYGPGYDRVTNLAEGATEEGWMQVDTDGDGVYESIRPNFNAYAQFGPEMKGQQVMWWDGKVRPYVAQPGNYKDLYRTGFNSIINAAVSDRTEKAAYRFSVTRNDYNGIQQGGNLQRNTFNFNSTYKINSRLSTDVVSSYVNSKVHNRPMQLNRILASYSGFFSRAEDMGLMFGKYKTSQGYKWVPWNQQQRNPDEALKYAMKNETLDFLWMQLRNSEDEDQDRLLTSFTINYEISKNFKLRARIGNDFTSLKTESRRYNEYPVAFNGSNSTGMYGISNGRYSILYGDGLLTYSKKLSKNFIFSVNGGYQARKEKYNDQHSATAGGLLKENWFSLENSFRPVNVTVNSSGMIKYAFLGFFNLAYKNYFFFEGTGRQEYSSTLPPGKNSYFYPSANAAFVFTEAFKLPSFLHYGKLRASYGLVGNAPPAYAAAVTYTQTTLPTVNGPVASLSAQANAGNNQVRPENKYEAELGMEIMMFKNRMGFDITYYNSHIIDQIVQLSVPVSTGAVSKLVNAGTLQSNGWELSLNVTLFSARSFKWNTQLNFTTGTTKVKKLADGVKQIIYYEGEQNAIRIVAEEGETVGNVYVYPRLTDDNGNHIIGSNGLYVIDNSRYIKAGNVMPRISGGWGNDISYKNIKLDVMVDYRFGGKLVSPVLKYNIGAGMYESTLQYRDAEHGGLPYYIDGNGVKVLLPDHNAAAPNGSKVYHDGIILKGVTFSKTANTTIVDAPYYYYNMFAWGPAALNDEGAVYNNSYIKMRELVLSYTFPVKLAQKMHFKNVKFSLVGRNLFYFYRTLKNLDPESPVGSSWTRQSIDDGSMAATRSFGFSLNLGF
jgi:iron complex outermembrane recepter protein